jgi:hypothetical protein
MKCFECDFPNFSIQLVMVGWGTMDNEGIRRYVVARKIRERKVKCDSELPL